MVFHMAVIAACRQAAREGCIVCGEACLQGLVEAALVLVVRGALKDPPRHLTVESRLQQYYPKIAAAPPAAAAVLLAF